MINVLKLTNELIAAGISKGGNCNSNGVVWDNDGNEIQTRPDVAAIIAAHNPDALTVDALWSHVNGLVSSAREAAGFDNNGSLRALGWKADADCPAWRLERIRAVEAWGDVAWMTYYALKAQLLAGQPIALPETIGECPYKFSDLLTE